MLEYLAIEDGYSNWRDWFHENILNDWNDTMPLASHVRLKVGLLLVSDLEECKGLLDPSRDLYSLLLRFSQTEDVFERIASTVTTPSEINSRSSFIIRDE